MIEPPAMHDKKGEKMSIMMNMKKTTLFKKNHPKSAVEKSRKNAWIESK